MPGSRRNPSTCQVLREALAATAKDLVVLGGRTVVFGHGSYFSDDSIFVVTGAKMSGIIKLIAPRRSVFIL